MCVTCIIAIKTHDSKTGNVLFFIHKGSKYIILGMHDIGKIFAYILLAYINPIHILIFTHLLISLHSSIY